MAVWAAPGSIAITGLASYLCSKAVFGSAYTLPDPKQILWVLCTGFLIPQSVLRYIEHRMWLAWNAHLEQQQESR